MKLFEQPWPADLPPHCPHCKRPFATGLNLSIGPGRLSRFFRACAYWSMVPWSVLAWCILACYLNDLTLAFVWFVPLILFMPFALVTPNSRRVRCAHCDYDHDFPAREGRRLAAPRTPSHTIQGQESRLEAAGGSAASRPTAQP